MLSEQSGVAVSGIDWYRAGNVDAFAVTNDGIQKGKKGMKPLQLKIVRSIKKGKKLISQQLMHTGCIYNFHFPSLPATSHLKERESSKEIILYLIYAILKIWPWSLSVRLKLHHITINCIQPTRRMSHLSPCASLSLSRLNILPLPPVIWGMSWTCNILLVYFLAQEGTAPLLSGQPGLQGLLKMPA